MAYSYQVVIWREPSNTALSEASSAVKTTYTAQVRLSIVMVAASIMIMLVFAVSATTLSLRERQLAVLQEHIDAPWPALSSSGGVSSWAEANVALAQLAHDRLGPNAPNATLTTIVSAQVAGWRDDPRFSPWGNYSVDGPLGGLGTLPILFRLALLPLTRAALSDAALATLEEIAFGWLSPRSDASWAAAPGSWLLQDGSENLDATRKACIYLAALVVNRTAPERTVALDGRAVREHAAAWERHWERYFAHRAVEGIGAELCSPTYAKYALQNFINIADLSSSAPLAALAADFLTLWFADAALAFLPSTGARGGAHNRVYRDAPFFMTRDDFSGFAWLYGWWWEANTAAAAAPASAASATSAGGGGGGGSGGGDASTTAHVPNVTQDAMRVPQMTLFASSSWHPPATVTGLARTLPPTGFVYTSRRTGDSSPCDQPLGPRPFGPTCTKLPCKPCAVCRGVPAFGGSSCELLSAPSSVVKHEYVSARRLYTLGAIALDVANMQPSRGGANYTAGVMQNHKVGAYIGGELSGSGAISGSGSLIAFGDAGSSNCSDPAFQRHSFGGMTSTLVPGAIAVVRPVAAKINPCVKVKAKAPGGGECTSSDFPMFAYVDAQLFASRTTAGDWTCFNSGGVVFACVGLSNGAKLTLAPAPCTGGSWNGSLLLFNGSKTSSSFGVLQMAVAEDFNHSFDTFVQHMAAAPIETDTADGALRYTSLGGDVLQLGKGGAQVPPFSPLAQSYDSPYVSAAYNQRTTVTVSAPGFDNLTLTFDASSWAGERA